MDNVAKPNFTAATGTTDAPPVADNTRLNELIAERQKRPEIGAIWTRQAKTNSMEYLKIRLRLTRKQLQDLLARTPETGNPEELPVTEFVAFPNTNRDNNSKRPAYRVYEAKD